MSTEWTPNEKLIKKASDQGLIILTSIIVIGMCIIILGQMLGSLSISIIGFITICSIFPLLWVIPEWVANRVFNNKTSEGST